MSRAACVLALSAALAVTAAGCNRAKPQSDVVTISGRTMGTTYSVKIAGLPQAHTREQVQKEIAKRLETVDRQMSTWRKDSEISRFNAQRGTGWFPVSPDTAKVVQEANRISELSAGAFDVTVGPLVNLWSFGPENRPQRVPADEEIAKRRQSVGFGKLDVRANPPALRKADPALSVDLSAIAKGFGVDRVAEYLDSLNAAGYMVEIGGEVRCRGSRSDGGDWRIGIQSPADVGALSVRAVALKNRSLATSGDYRNYFEQDGRRYSHTIDPRTGRPVRHALASVSVLAESCMTADALATTIMVLGPERGREFARRHKLAVLLLVAEGDGFRQIATPAFNEAAAALDKSDAGAQ